jgi:hypothetical protein
MSSDKSPRAYTPQVKSRMTLEGPLSPHHRAPARVARRSIQIPPGCTPGDCLKEYELEEMAYLLEPPRSRLMMPTL